VLGHQQGSKIPKWEKTSKQHHPKITKAPTKKYKKLPCPTYYFDSFPLKDVSMKEYD